MRPEGSILDEQGQKSRLEAKAGGVLRQEALREGWLAPPHQLGEGAWGAM